LTPREEENILQQTSQHCQLRRLKFHPISFLEWSYLKKIETDLQSGLTPIPCHDYRLLPIWKSESAVRVQREIENFYCPQCWTPCEAYQSILGNLAPRIFTFRKRWP